MHIVQIIDSLDWGGAQKMQVLLAQAAVGVPIKLTVISLSNYGNQYFKNEIESLGIPVITLSGRSLFDLPRFWKILSVLRNERVDILHAHLTYANILGTFAGFICRIPTIASIRTAGIDMDFFHPWRYGLETWLLRFVASYVMVNGYAIADANQARLKGRKITVIQNAISVPEELSADERLEIRKEIIGDPSCFMIIAVGRLAAPKGYHDLLEAVVRVREKHRGVKLVIVGDGHLTSEIDTRISELTLEDHVTLLGARTNVTELLLASDLFVNSSHWEGMSVAVLEAMAAGLPVVATNVGDSALVVENDTGTVVSPHQPDEIANAITALLDDPDKLQMFGKNARKRVITHYSPASWMSNLMDFYTEVNSSFSRSAKCQD